MTDGQLRLRQGAKVQIKAAARQRPGGGIMNFTGLFIRRPVMTTLVMAGILIFGLVAYRQLPVSDLPNGGLPDHLGAAPACPGASPETMASAVATPLEKQFSTIAGIDAMTSTSGQGSTQITLQFALDRNIDAAAQDVQAAISQTLRQLPQDMLPPQLPEGEPGAIADPLLRAHARRRCRCRSSTSTPRPSWPSGSRRSTAWRRCRCSARRSTRCGFSSIPQQLAAREHRDRRGGARRSQNGNVNLPTGILWGTDKAYAVESQRPAHRRGRRSASLVVAYRNGAPVRLRRSRAR